MRTLRQTVLPVLRLAVWAVIAVALVVLAFRNGADPGEASRSAASPAPVQLDSPVVPVTTGDVENTVTVQGAVAADPAVPVKATAAGTVRRLLVAPGATVTKDQPVLEITVELPADPVAAAPDATGAVAAPKPKVRTATVKAPAAGRVASLDVLVDQTVAVGDVLGSVSPGTLSVTAPLTQAEQFRLLSPPATAQVTVRGGPAPFTCTGLTLGGEQPATAAPPSGSTDPSAQPSSPTTGTTARCAVPAGTTVFAGMAATVAVQAGTATAVPLLPVTAVQGSVQAGKVWVVGADGGEPVETPVTLGLTDGDQVQITGGVTEGQQVLQFVPVPDDTPADGAPGGMGFGG